MTALAGEECRRREGELLNRSPRPCELPSEDPCLTKAADLGRHSILGELVVVEEYWCEGRARRMREEGLDEGRREADAGR